MLIFMTFSASFKIDTNTPTCGGVDSMIMSQLKGWNLANSAFYYYPIIRLRPEYQLMYCDGEFYILMEDKKISFFGPCQDFIFKLPISPVQLLTTSFFFFFPSLSFKLCTDLIEKFSHTLKYFKTKSSFR